MPQNKKIALGVNLFGKTNRTDLCVDSLLKIKEKYPDTIDLYNIQFEDKSIVGREHPSFKPLHVLKESNKTYVPESTRTIPLMREIFDRLTELKYEYFAFTNDDIIISDRLIKYFLETDLDSWPVSRLAIENIFTLTDPITGDHYQVAGFDTFIIKTSWWKEHSSKFPNYILGHPCWDVHYATLCLRHGVSKFVNGWPPPTFHIKHGGGSQYENYDNDYNNSLYWKPCKFDVDMWHNYLFNVLLVRPGANYWQPHPNEAELEKMYFNDEWFKNNYWSYEDFQKKLTMQYLQAAGYQ
jgi:hypothetical protein